MARGASQAGGTKKKVVGIVGFIVIAKTVCFIHGSVLRSNT